MTKRSSVRLLSFGLLLAGILIIYAITGTVQAAQYRARLESTYRQSLHRRLSLLRREQA